MARHITEELGGLPISIESNKIKIKIIWQQLNSKLKKLRCSSNCIPRFWQRDLPTIKSVPTIRTEVELCLLISGMFPEDFSIPIEDLVLYGMGLELFQDHDHDMGAIDRVHRLIKTINNERTHDISYLSLLKDEYGNQYVKVLVGGRDLVKSIASRYQLVFDRGTLIEKWPESNVYEYCYGLSLVLKKIGGSPVNLECPNLALLQLQYGEDSRLPADFFEGMKELQVLCLNVPSLPQSLNELRNLNTLHLKVLKSKDLSVIGGLINLEFLSVSTLRLTDIPREMGQLGNLKLLDLRKMNLAYIPPGILSGMLKLKELYLPLSFRRWGCNATDVHDDYDEWESTEEDDYDDGERINANLSEISHSLNALQISIPKASILPKRSPIFKNIQWFRILMPNNRKYQPFGKHLINELQFTGDACHIKESGICDLLSRTEELSLTMVRNLKNVMYQLEEYDFPLLKKMIISECDELEYVVDTTEKQILPEYYSFWRLESLHLSMLYNLKEIWHGRWITFRWFENLSQISIRFCHKLKYVFPQSIARGWILLKSIEILDCNEMEGVFYEDEENDIPYFVEKLDLHSLPKLVGFLVHKENTSDGFKQSLTINEVVSNSMDGSINTFDGSISRLNESCIDNVELICPPPISKSTGKLQQNVIQQFFSNKQVSLIKNKDIISHTETCCAFSSELMDGKLNYLRKVKIAFCDLLKVIFSFKDEHDTTQVLNSLEELELYGLRNLTHIWFRIPSKIMAFQKLQILNLSECHNLSYVFSPQVAKLLVGLQKLQISRCEKMEEIVSKESDSDRKVMDKIFPQLKALELQHIPNLRIFYAGFSAMNLPLLEFLKFNDCDKMDSFSYRSLKTPMLERVQINKHIYSSTGDLNATLKRLKVAKL
ncbi:uncharacterized protein [Euphorbia lathyris]|uniref:uncharacterized protein n=1 Tax=Euphorbia lathyris TaxID=212925 RepID=UPI003313B1AF